jgi:glycosyltransferase involved in cell wall biosynthesis
MDKQNHCSEQIISPFFSIVIPTYNSSQFIEQAIDSVFKQTYQDYEIIVVDDGSIDETVNILKKCNSNIAIITQENKGPGAARNRGIREAKGAYITFLDSDDVWFPWALEIFKEVIFKYDKPSFIIGSFVKFTDPAVLANVNRTPLRVKRYKDYYATSGEPLLFGTCSVAIKREILDVVGGFTNIRMNAEDNDLWLRLGVAPGLVHVTVPPVFAYRQHATSIVKNNDMTYLGMSRIIEKEKKGRYPGGKARKIERLKVLSAFARSASTHLLRYGEVRYAWQLYKTILWWNLRLGRARYLVGFLVLIGIRVLSNITKKIL